MSRGIFKVGKFKVDSGPENLVSISDCITAFYIFITNLYVLCDLKSVFVTNRCLFAVCMCRRMLMLINVKP